MAQFYTDDLDNKHDMQVPIDNFYWKTDDGRKISLVMVANHILVGVDSADDTEISTSEHKSVADALRELARLLGELS